MSEETTNLESTEPLDPSTLTSSERIRMAGEALGNELSDAVDLEADDEPVVNEEALQEAEAKEEKAEEKPEEKKEEDYKEDPPNWKWQRLREKTKAVKAREEKLLQAQQETEALKGELQTLADSIVTDPVATFRALAERAGIPEDDLFQRLVNGKVEQGVDSPEMRRIRQLEQQLQEKEETNRKKAEERRVKEATEARVQYVESLATQAAMIPDSPEYSERYPNLALLDKAEIKGQTRYAVDWALKNNPQATFPELLDLLEETQREKNQRLFERYESRRDGPKETQQARKPEPKNIGSNSSTPAPPTKSSIDMPFSERIKLAAKVL